ncbi:MAG TPA: hypothetical protein VNT27_15140 [Propionibacteriaceae bacterium]|nr:hypothetical protein [Propionibacteriaceae bacterium]
MDIAQLYLRSQRRPAEGGAGPSQAIVRHVIQILAGLGHPDRIAQLLIEERASGTKSDGARCVLADHLKAVTGFSTILVGRNATKYPGGCIEHPLRYEPSCGGSTLGTTHSSKPHHS